MSLTFDHPARCTPWRGGFGLPEMGFPIPIPRPDQGVPPLRFLATSDVRETGWRLLVPHRGRPAGRQSPPGRPFEAGAALRLSGWTSGLTGGESGGDQRRPHPATGARTPPRKILSLRCRRRTSRSSSGSAACSSRAIATGGESTSSLRWSGTPRRARCRRRAFTTATRGRAVVSRLARDLGGLRDRAQAEADHLRFPHVVDDEEVTLGPHAAPPAGPALTKRDHDRVPGVDVLAVYESREDALQATGLEGPPSSPAIESAKSG